MTWLGRKRWFGLVLIVAAAAAAAAGVVGVRGIAGVGHDAPRAAAENTAASPDRLNGLARIGGRYIIVYRQAPLATYKGDIAGLPAPERTQARSRAAAAPGDGRIAVKGARAQDYVRFLESEQVANEARISRVIGRRLVVERRMQHALNAVVAEMSEQEAERVRQLPQVRFVEAYREYEQDSDVGPALIGAPAMWNAKPSQFHGEGVVIGIIDSGINFGSPSFSAKDELGYVHVNPLGAGVHLGTCAAGGVDEGRCNDKLIGGYDFVCGEPGNLCGQNDIREEPGFGDSNGHGSHVASIAAGNVRTASYRGNRVRMSGVAPRANIIAYDACYTQISTGRGLCPNTATVRSIDQAIADGIVDVLNFSIGGGASPWSEATSLSFLNAADAGIYVATSAGNSGPGPNTMGHLEPWTASTAAATHGRGEFAFLAQVTGPGQVPEALRTIVLTEGSGGTPFAATLPAATPLRVSAGIDTSADGCAAYAAGTFQGAIAVVRRGGCNFTDKAANAAAAGAVALIIANHQAGSLSPAVSGAVIPVFAIERDVGNAIRDFAAGVGNAATATIGFPAVGLPDTADVLGSFSSRGPAGELDLLKPDVTAPGVAVLGTVSGTAITGSESAVELMSGTSMASPHHAGAAALLRQAQPAWTVHELKSALMMTAAQEVFLEDSVTPADALAKGAGRLQVDQAARAGLVLNESTANFLAADPASGGHVSTLNLASMARRECASTCSFTRVFRNVLGARQSWVLRAQGLSAVISPALITLNPGETKSVKITVTTGALPKDGSWHSGALVLTPRGGNVAQPVLRLPIAVAVQPPRIDATPATSQLTLPAGGSGMVALRVNNLGGSPLEWQIDNTGAGGRTLVEQAPNLANGRRSTRFTDAATIGARAQLAADDFSLVDATAITRIQADGFVNGGSLATSTDINWSIFRDVGGHPEGNPESSPQLAVWSHTSTVSGPGVSTSGFASIHLDLAAAGQSVNLAAGRYWLVVSVRAPLATGWFWFQSTSGDNVYRSVIVNPDGSGAWSAASGAPGLAHALQGSNACGASWIGLPTRAFGRAAPASGMDTQVRIDTAGLGAGSYSGYVCVSSNDPVRPKVALRVSLTVTP